MRRRTCLPHHFIDLDEDPRAAALLRELGVSPQDAPVVVLRSNEVLRNPRALNAQIDRAAAGDYLRLAWLATSLATLAGVLGSLVESDLAVREAAYGYRPSREAGDDGTVAGDMGTSDLPERRR